MLEIKLELNLYIFINKLMYNVLEMLKLFMAKYNPKRSTENAKELGVVQILL